MRTELKLMRVKHHLSQEECADAVGCSRVTYANIEQGKRNGTIEFWMELQRAFDVPDDEMWHLVKDERN